MLSSRKKLLFVVNQKDYNVFNRKSAIDSILCSILLELGQTYDIYVNGNSMSKDFVYNAGAISSLSSTSFIKRIVPGFVKQFLRDLKVFKTNDELFNEISQKVKPDVILELMRYGSDLGFRLKKHFSIPLIAYFDAPSVEENKYLRGNYSPFYGKVNRFEEHTIKEADKIIVYSEAIRDYWMERIAGLDSDKFNIFQTLDYTRLTFNFEKRFSEPLTIGFVGSFLKWHRVENLVKAFNKLRDAKYDIRLLLIGAGEEYTAIRELVNASPWKQDITLTGFIDGEKLKAYRNKIDIGVMPGTHWYCMPTKVFEYGASGIASIAPGTKSIKCMFTDKEVIFLEQNSETELYLKLKLLLDDQTRMSEMASNLRAKIKSRNSIDQASIFYNNLISQTI